ncbi:MAG: 30S ribosomal protein S4 [Candidatus Pacearchaeota archaeon]
MKRKHKKYSKPKRSFDKQRIEEEAKIMEEFGLKNKREIWKAESKVKSIREKAKKLIQAKDEEKEALFIKLQKIGFNVKSIGDVLSLTTRDYLKRRLQTILVKKRIVGTPKAARQLIVHKKIMVGDNVINSPSYIVPIDLEDKIFLRKKIKKENSVKLKEEKNEKMEATLNGA